LATYGELKRDWVKLYKQGFAVLTTAGRSPIDYSKAPARPVPGLANDGYVGAYHNDFFGEVEIVAKGGELVMHQGPRKTPFSLKHYNRNVFFHETAGENEVGLAKAKSGYGRTCACSRHARSYARLRRGG
jgi:hypothetical protein